MKRLFFALWPDSETRRRCAELTKRLRSSGRPVAAGNLHVTLVFLGGVDAAIEAQLLEAAAAVRFTPITVVFSTLSYWRRPRIICLSAEHEDPAALALVERLNQLAATLNIPTDTRPYQAHVTLLRKAQRLAPLPFEPIAWKSDAFCLVESTQGPEGTLYRVLHRWYLSAPENKTASPTD